MSLPTKTDKITARVVYLHGDVRIVKRGEPWEHVYDVELRQQDALHFDKWVSIGCFSRDKNETAASARLPIEHLFAEVLSRHTDTPVLTTLELDSLANRLLVAAGGKGNAELQATFRRLLVQAMHMAYPMRPEA